MYIYVYTYNIYICDELLVVGRGLTGLKGAVELKIRPLLDVLRRKETPKNVLEKSKKLEIAVPRPLSPIYDDS